MAILWSVLAGLAITTTIFAIGRLVFGDTETAESRLQRMTARGSEAIPSLPATPPDSPDMMPTIGLILKRYSIAERLQVQLYAAGLSMRPSEFVGVILCIAVILQLIAAGMMHSITAGIVFGLVCGAVPVYGLKFLQNKRRTTFDSQIPDALTLLASSLKSGFSFLRGMQMIAQEMPPPISQEFRRTINEVSIGKPLDKALSDIVARVNSYDIDLVVTAVEVHLSVGGNLAEVLETIAGTIHERNKVLAEMKALTAEGTLSGFILVILPMALAVTLIVMNPKYMGVLINEPLGNYMIGFAVLFQIIGIVVIKRMLVLDV